MCIRDRCDIFRELGKDGLCKACRDYPRHREDYGKLQEFMLSMSCPEAARLILEDETQGAGYAYIPRHPHDDAAEKYKGNNRDNHLSAGKIPGRKKRQNEEDREEEQMLAWLLELRETLVCLITVSYTHLDTAACRRLHWQWRIRKSAQRSAAFRRESARPPSSLIFTGSWRICV